MQSGRLCTHVTVFHHHVHDYRAQRLQRITAWCARRCLALFLVLPATVLYRSLSSQYLEWKLRGVYKTGTVNQTIHAFPTPTSAPLGDAEPTATAAASSTAPLPPASAARAGVHSGKSKFVDFIPASNALVSMSGKCAAVYNDVSIVVLRAARLRQL